MAEEAGASKKPKKYTGILLHPTSLIFWNVRD